MYSSDGTSLGLRSLEAAKRLIEGGYVKPAHGRKGHLKAVWLPQQDGGNPVAPRARAGTRYSFLRKLSNGQHCWELRQVDGRDGAGTRLSMRSVFLRVLEDCCVT